MDSTDAADITETEEKTALVVFTPSGKRGRFALGTPVLVAARRLGVDLDTVCGGRGICGRCQIIPSFGEFSKHGLTASRDAISEWNKVEERYKTKRSIADIRRLGCQATILGDLVIDVPPDSQVHRQVVRKTAGTRAIERDPAIRLVRVTVEEPDMHNPKGDFERLSEALQAETGLARITCDLDVIQGLQKPLRAGGWTVSCALRRGADEAAAELVEVWPDAPDVTPKLLGVAFDIGSTTIAGHLIDLETGEGLASAGLMNPQIRFGEDLMSRVSYVMMNPGGEKELTSAIRAAINELVGELCTEASAPREAIFESVFVGNPVMHHLLLGIDPTELGGAPFALAVSGALTLPATALDLALHPRAETYILPCIAGHVGADAAAVVLSEAPQKAEAMTLLVDVGTNAEIILGDKDGLLACSSPTGPAFEGAQISAGQRAAPGAIERIRIDPVTKEPRFRVIGSDLWSNEDGFANDTAATGITGICGSGIIEVIAEMRMAGIIDEDGSVRGELAAETPRIFADGRTFSYLLHEDAEGRRIVVTQNDVRAIQLAKAALYAGCKLLMEKRGVETLDRVKLAGAFGAHISPLHAMVLGMIPDCEIDRVTSVGNAAGDGARIALLNVGARREIEAVVRQIDKIETAVEPRFQEHFVNAMAVPNKIEGFPKLSELVTLPKLAPQQNQGGGRRGGQRAGRRGAGRAGSRDDS